MCCLVTGGKGNSVYPISTGPAGTFSLVVSCTLMMNQVGERNSIQNKGKQVPGRVMTPLLGESS